MRNPAGRRTRARSRGPLCGSAGPQPRMNMAQRQHTPQTNDRMAIGVSPRGILAEAGDEARRESPKGNDIVAGGNAPGSRPLCEPTPKGSNGCEHRATPSESAFLLDFLLSRIASSCVVWSGHDFRVCVIPPCGIVRARFQPCRLPAEGDSFLTAVGPSGGAAGARFKSPNEGSSYGSDAKPEFDSCRCACRSAPACGSAVQIIPLPFSGTVKTVP